MNGTRTNRNSLNTDSTQRGKSETRAPSNGALAGPAQLESRESKRGHRRASDTRTAIGHPTAKGTSAATRPKEDPGTGRTTTPPGAEQPGPHTGQAARPPDGEEGHHGTREPPRRGGTQTPGGPARPGRATKAQRGGGGGDRPRSSHPTPEPRDQEARHRTRDRPEGGGPPKSGGTHTAAKGPRRDAARASVKKA